MPNTVDVMDALTLDEWAAKFLFHDEPMFRPECPINANLDIADGVLKPVGSRIPPSAFLLPVEATPLNDPNTRFTVRLSLSDLDSSVLTAGHYAWSHGSS